MKKGEKCSGQTGCLTVPNQINSFMRIDEIDRRGFLKGIGALAAGGALGSANASKQQSDGLDASPNWVYVWWYCGSLQDWLPPKEYQLYKTIKAPAISNNNDTIREKAWRDAAMFVTRAGTGPKADDAIRQRAIKALHMII